jgi:hypothetical protein
MAISLAGIPLPLAATPLERTLRRVFAGALLVALIAIVAALATHTHAEAVVMGSVISILALGMVVMLGARRSVRALEANHFLICPRCLAPLADVAAARLCPRCGFDFESPEALEDLWRAIYKQPRPSA